VLAVLLLVPLCEAIGVIIIGQAVPSNAPHMFWLMNEPGFEDICLIPTMQIGLAQMAGQAVNLEQARRRVRIYFPRSEERLLQYNFTMYAGAILEPFAARQISSMHRAIRDGGMGALVSVGGLTVDSINRNYVWLNSVLAQAFPNDPLGSDTFEMNKDLGAIYTVEINRDESLAEVLTPFLPYGIEKWPGNCGTWMLPRPGTKCFAWIKGLYKGLGGVPKAPYLLSWEYGQGTTWSQADSYTHLWWSSYFRPTQNEFGHDILVNMILYALGMDLPRDVVVVHQLRKSFEHYSVRKMLIFSLLDFVEKMGGRTDSILRELSKNDEVFERSRSLFAEQKYEESRTTFDSSLAGLDAIELLGMKTKSRVLLWTYVIEYLVVSATFLLSASLLYEIMVRRRLLRQVDTTRHSPIEEGG
jgi:hypothetical protein